LLHNILNSKTFTRHHKREVPSTWENATNRINMGIPISTQCPTWEKKSYAKIWA